jgi:WD40 repeat protein
MKRRVIFFVVLIVSALLAVGCGYLFNPTVEGISLNLACAGELNSDNIGQISLLEQYKAGDTSTRIQFSYDGSILGFSNYAGVHVIDFNTQQHLYFKHHDQDSTSVFVNEGGMGFAFGQDNRLLATYSSNKENEGSLKLWDIGSGAQMAIIEPARSIFPAAISPSNEYLVFSYSNVNDGIYVVDLRDPQYPKRLISSDGTVSIAFNPVNDEEVFYSTDKGVTVFDISQDAVEAQLAAPYSLIEISPDGTQLLTRDINEAALWNLTTGNKELSISPEDLGPVEINWKAHLLAYGDENDIILMDTLTGNQMLRLTGHSIGIADLSFHPNAPLLASAGLDQAVRVWDITTGKQVFRQSMKDLVTLQAQFNPQGTLLAISTNADVQLWGNDIC